MKQYVMVLVYDRATQEVLVAENEKFFGGKAIPPMYELNLEVDPQDIESLRKLPGMTAYWLNSETGAETKESDWVYFGTISEVEDGQTLSLIHLIQGQPGGRVMKAIKQGIMTPVKNSLRIRPYPVDSYTTTALAAVYPILAALAGTDVRRIDLIVTGLDPER